MVTYYISVNKYNKRSEYVYVMTYGENKRTLKMTDLSLINDSLNIWLEQKGRPHISLELEHRYGLSMEPSEVSDLIYLLETGTNKKKVHFCDGLDMTINGVYLSHSYRDVSEFKQHWLTQDNTPHRLLEQLSQDILETPYADDPEDYEVRYGKVVFHLNHGTAHAIRSVILLNFIIHFLNIYGQEMCESCLALHNMSPEEKACLNLAVFLFRSGRTNELGWRGDPSYSQRSAAIFTQIALDLGHNSSLVYAIVSCFDFESTIDLKRGFLDNNIEQSNKKAKLYQKMLHVTHTCDLARCCSSKDHLLDVLAHELRELLTNHRDISELLEFILNFSEKLCQETGAPIAYERPDRDLYFGSAYKAVDVSTNVERTFARLETLMNQELDLYRSLTLQMPSQVNKVDVTSAEPAAPEESNELITRIRTRG